MEDPLPLSTSPSSRRPGRSGGRLRRQLAAGCCGLLLCGLPVATATTATAATAAAAARPLVPARYEQHGRGTLVRHLYDSPGEVFRAPYDRGTEALFDGSHTGRQLEEGTPGTLEELLAEHGRAMLAHPAGPLAQALRTTDAVCTGWAPRAPVRLFMATGDEQAVTANTEDCLTALRERRAARVVDVGAAGYHGSRHRGSEAAAAPAIVRWFGEVTRG
ncbi:hypothetical protein [Streptomyces sp. NPDC001135]